MPWKTASQTMALRLEQYNECRYSRFFYYNEYLNRVVHQHITCADFACLPESKLGYLVASFVRNPYDRVYSGFRQLQKDIEIQPQAHGHYPTPWIERHVMKQLAENQEQFKKANFQFDQWLGSITQEQVYEAGRNSNFPLHPAYFWTHVAGKQAVDFVGKVENFEADFKNFLELVDIKQVQQVNDNVVDLETNTNPHGYRYLDRMSPKSIQKINKLFEKDFELFGYQKI
jgi:hypothetical protein